ncbi:MAG: hypothetical protein CFE24_01395 [Flavobacterium sp. BFFFF2]|nr:MAG: hypothetical protein CFE24_01395 [Flavobacterium sp. BFFFF2]
MRKFLLLFLALGSFVQLKAQCLDSTNGQYPAATHVPLTCDGLTVAEITTAGYASEYSLVTVTQGTRYVFTSSTATDIVTIITADGTTALAFGTGSVEWISTLSGNVRFNTSLDDGACGAESVSRTRSVLCGDVPTCYPTTSITASVITTTTATVSLTETNTPNLGYEGYVSTSSTPPTATTTPTFTIDYGNTDTGLTNLTPATTYYCWIRSVCATTDRSVWRSVSFTTLCVAVSEFYQGFDGSLNMPTCWAKIGTGGSANVQTAGISITSPNVLYIYSTDTTSLGVVSLPAVTNAGAGTHRLRFSARANFTVGGILEVGYLTIPSDDASFVSLQTFTTTSTTAYDRFIANLGVAPGANNVLAFRNSGSPANSILIDDVFWEPIPTCEEPTALVAGTTTSNSAAISWTAPSFIPQNGFEYYISNSPTMPSSTTVANGTFSYTATSGVINNLTDATVYYIWIRSVCGASDVSVWSNRITVTTLCLPVTTFTQNFDASLNMPTCWAKVGTDGSASVQATTGTTSSPNNLYIYSGSTTTLAVVSMPQVSNAGAGTHRLRFRTRANFTVGGVIEVGYLTNPTDATTFVAIQSVTTTSTTSYDSWTVYPGTAVGSNSVLAFRHTGSPANSVLIDDVVWEPVPSCIEVTSVTAGNTTQTSVSFSWTALSTSTATGYDYYVSTSATSPVATTTPTGSVTSDATDTMVTGLTPSTVYYIWVRSSCSTTDQSTWSAAVTAVTLCTASQAPYSQDFETAVVPAMPICTSQLNVGIGNSWQVSSNPGYGFASKTLQYTYNSSNPANAWFFTNPITLTAGMSYNVSYKYGNNSTTYVEKLKVACGQAASVAGMTTVLADHTNITGGTTTSTATSNTVVFSPQVSGDYMFGFNVYSDTNQYYLYVDDITVSAGFGTNTVQESLARIYPNPAKDRLTVALPIGITQIKLVNILGQQVAVNHQAASEVTLDVSTLPSGTYMAQITDSNGLTSTVKWIKE